MNYINKNIAENTAFNMLKSAREKIEAKENELSDYCEKLVIKSIPTDTFSIISSLPEGYIQKRSDFYFRCGSYGNNIAWQTNKRIPYLYSSYFVEVSPKEYENIKSKKDAIKLMKDKNNQIKEQIVSTLLRLRTAKRIKSEFPEAFNNLPKDSLNSNNAISLPIEKILSNINNFPE